MKAILVSTVFLGLSLWGALGTRHAPSHADFRPTRTGAAPAVAGHQPPEGIARHVKLLKEGEDFLAHRSDYTATFVKQEVVGGQLFEPEEICLKVRHSPFSVFMKWNGCKRQALYYQGQNNNSLVVREGGLKGMFGSVSLDPHSDLAMSAARYPITEIGMLELNRKVLAYRERDLTLAHGCHCRIDENAKIDNRDCILFVVEYDSADIEPLYRKCMTYIDKEWNAVTCSRNFTWPDEENAGLKGADLDELTMIENYVYSDVHFDKGLSDSDFDVDNKDYVFNH